jgi:hypothetical protein
VEIHHPPFAYRIDEQATAYTYTDHATITELTLAGFSELALGFSQKPKD